MVECVCVCLSVCVFVCLCVCVCMQLVDSDHKPVYAKLDMVLPSYNAEHKRQAAMQVSGLPFHHTPMTRACGAMGQAFAG